MAKKEKQNNQEGVAAEEKSKPKGRRFGKPKQKKALEKAVEEVSRQTDGYVGRFEDSRKKPKHHKNSDIFSEESKPKVKAPTHSPAKKKPIAEITAAVEPKQTAPKQTSANQTASKQTAQKQENQKQPKHLRSTRRNAEAVEKSLDPKLKLRIIPLGGINEIGKNMTAIEYGDDIIVIDCGISFPDEDMPGIDLVIPDVTYLENNIEKVRGILLTHGHEDHIGAIPYILRTIKVPVYGTRLTLGIIKNKLEELPLTYNPDLRCVYAGDTVNLGVFSAEFIRVNHSIADACAIAVTTPMGIVVHTGDFKLDLSPIEGEMIDLVRLGELGKQGVTLLMCESTNAERPGYTPSEKKVGESFETIYAMNKEKRIVIATFSSNVHRVQQIIDISVKYGRKVAITGRSMMAIVNAAVELGYMNVPAGALIDISEIKKFTPNQLTVVCTGSQGEPMSALYRMAFGDHNQVTLGPTDLVVLSASAIPGNEKTIGRIVNELTRRGAKVVHDTFAGVHVSGHACQEELKLMQALLRPKYFMPIHGEYSHLAANRDLALYMGMDPKHIFIADLGQVLEIGRNGAAINGTVPAGRVFVDGYGVGDVGNVVLRDRKHLAQDGLIVAVVTIDTAYREIVSGPDIISRGFVYVKESEVMMEEAKRIAGDIIYDMLDDAKNGDWMEIKEAVKESLTKFFFSRTGRKPMILPVVMNM